MWKLTLADGRIETFQEHHGDLAVEFFFYYFGQGVELSFEDKTPKKVQRAA